jgi:type II pantothenate kinase
MVLQTIGSASILSSLNSGIRDFVLIGNLSRLPQCKELYPHLERIYDVRFIIPKSSEFCTAIGAALSYVNNKRPPLTPPEGGGEPTPMHSHSC